MWNGTGYPRVKAMRTEEALDCRVYALAAAHIVAGNGNRCSTRCCGSRTRNAAGGARGDQALIRRRGRRAGRRARAADRGQHRAVGGGMRELTAPQRRALAFLATVPSASPAMIGEALTRERRPPLSPQGAGRLGGTMGARLCRMGLAWNASYDNSGFPAYQISPSGRRELQGRVVAR